MQTITHWLRIISDLQNDFSLMYDLLSLLSRNSSHAGCWSLETVSSKMRNRLEIYLEIWVTCLPTLNNGISLLIRALLAYQIIITEQTINTLSVYKSSFWSIQGHLSLYKNLHYWHVTHQSGAVSFALSTNRIPSFWQFSTTHHNNVTLLVVEIDILRVGWKLPLPEYWRKWI